MQRQPKIVVLAGPNGAGKSTAAPRLLPGFLGVSEFVNADTIAQGLSGFAPEGVAIAAGRLLLARIRELASRGDDFAFETTLASRTFAPWLQSMSDSGFKIHVVFLWLVTADIAVSRVAGRVRAGGHDVPEATVRRRYHSGIVNFFKLYQPVADTWKVIDNSRVNMPKVIAAGRHGVIDTVKEHSAWQQFCSAAESKPA